MKLVTYTANGAQSVGAVVGDDDTVIDLAAADRALAKAACAAAQFALELNNTWQGNSENDKREFAERFAAMEKARDAALEEECVETWEGGARSGARGECLSSPLWVAAFRWPLMLCVLRLDVL